MPAPPNNAPARPIGAHAPITGGLATGSLRYAEAVGAEAIQIFVTNPRAWAISRDDDQQDAALREHVTSSGLPVFVHAPYLVNVGSPDRLVRQRSAEALSRCLRRAAQIAARGVVVHTGSATTGDRGTALRLVRDTVLPLLDELPADGPDLLIEPMAGQGQMLCAMLADIGPYLDALDRHAKVCLCLDTCHVFAAGHDLTAEDGVDKALAEVAEVASGRLRLIHANDSKDRCGSNRDRHENIGKGQLGRQPFRALLHHPATAGVAFITETPGGRQAHARDVAALKRLRRPVTGPRRKR